MAWAAGLVIEIVRLSKLTQFCSLLLVTSMSEIPYLENMVFRAVIILAEVVLVTFRISTCQEKLPTTVV